MTADGQHVACGRGNEISVYKAGSGRLIARLVDPSLSSHSGPARPGIAHLDVVQSLAFSPSGDLLASGAFREVKVWQRPRNVRRGELAGASEAVAAVAASPDGKWAATGESNGTIKLWELASHQTKHTLSGHGGAITGLRFSLDSGKLFSSSKDKTIRGWSVADGAAAGKIDAPAEVNGIALVNDGKEIVSADADNTLRVWAHAGRAAAGRGAEAAQGTQGARGPGECRRYPGSTRGRRSYPAARTARFESGTTTTASSRSRWTRVDRCCPWPFAPIGKRIASANAHKRGAVVQCRERADGRRAQGGPPRPLCSG